MFLQEGQDVFWCQVIFEQIVIDAKFHGFVHIGKVVVAAQDEDMPRQFLLPHFSYQADAVEHGHADVGDDERRLFLFDEPQGLPAVLGIARNREAMCLPVDHLLEVRADQEIIIGNNHFIHQINPLSFDTHRHHPA